VHVAVLFKDGNSLKLLVTVLAISVKNSLFTSGSYFAVLCTGLNCSNIYC
jgi:hypothetical protein